MASSLVRRAGLLMQRSANVSRTRCLSVIQSYGPISDDLRDAYTPLHPSLQSREKDNEGRGVADRPVTTKVGNSKCLRRFCFFCLSFSSGWLLVFLKYGRDLAVFSCASLDEHRTLFTSCEH